MTPLRLLRLAHGYVKQETFAIKCHMAESHLCRLELGQRKPSEGLANTIADVLGESVRKVFPDGFAERPKCYKRRIDDGVGYSPDMPPASIRARVTTYPTRCPRCQAQVFGVSCYACGADLGVLEEAHV